MILSFSDIVYLIESETFRKNDINMQHVFLLPVILLPNANPSKSELTTSNRGMSNTTKAQHNGIDVISILKFSPFNNNIAVW